MRPAALGATAAAAALSLALAVAPAACRKAPRGRVVSSAGATAPQQRSEEQALIARNESLPSDPSLAERYADLDERYFGGKLPAVVVRWDAGLDGVRIPAAGGLRLEGLWGRADGGPVILLAERLKADPKRAAATLCHEMIHEYLDTVGHSGARHGPPFQAQLKRLFDAGAFEALAPSQGEKEGLAVWLKEQAARLDDVNAEVKARRAALRPDSSHDEVVEFNALVRRQNLMAGDYNREAERYNAMLAYPDGLDEPRLLAGLAGAAAERR